MSLIIIYMTGPSNTGKSSTIRRFTANYLKYNKARGDVLGVFPMPRRSYSIGVNGYGDNLKVVKEGLEFLKCYRGLSVMIVACHLKGSVTFREVVRFAKKSKASLHPIKTFRLTDRPAQKAAIRANVKEIMRLLPGRER